MMKAQPGSNEILTNIVRYCRTKCSNFALKVNEVDNSQFVRKSAYLISAVRNGRGSRLCDGDANSNALESKPSKRDRRNSPAHGHNKAGHRPRYSR